MPCSSVHSEWHTVVISFTVVHSFFHWCSHPPLDLRTGGWGMQSERGSEGKKKTGWTERLRQGENALGRTPMCFIDHNHSSYIECDFTRTVELEMCLCLNHFENWGSHLTPVLCRIPDGHPEPFLFLSRQLIWRGQPFYRRWSALCLHRLRFLCSWWSLCWGCWLDHHCW